ncbi:MAG: hypothetical protein AAGF79_12120 [Pseudomonadota bacterium]
MVRPLAFGLLLAAFGTLCAADPCTSAQSTLTQAVQAKLSADLEVQTLQFRRKTILDWRSEFGIPGFLKDELVAVRTRLDTALPLAEQADNNFEEARYWKDESCPDAE